MSSGGGSGSQTTSTEPPKFIQPYLQDAAGQSRGLYDQGGPQYYGGNTVVPFSQQTEDSLALTEGRARAGSPVTHAAQDYAQGILSKTPTSQFGNTANPYASADNPYGNVNNPYLDATFNKAADSVQNRLSSQFAGSGRNIGASRAVNADELNNLANTVYGGAYNDERNRGLQYQQQLTGIGAQGYESERDRMASDLDKQRSMQFGVAGLAPDLANQDYADYQQLGGVGQQVEDLSGRLMQDSAARWDYNQNAPGINLDNYISRLTGSYPGQSTTTPIYRNRTAGAVGGAAAGAQIGSQIYPGWGTAIGAVAGGLLGYQ
jgi:hypothetical protein